MRNVSLKTICFVALTAMAPTGYAFTPDEFNTPTLGAHWEYVPSPLAAPTTQTMTGTQLELEGPLDSDHYIAVETQAYIQQNAPTTDNWEIVTRIDDWNPTQAGQTRRFSRVGLEIWQDDENQLCLSLLSSFNGDEIGYQCFWQTFPAGANGNNWPRYEGKIDCNNMGVAPERYIKLKKTHKGYVGFISTDGSTWLQCSSIIRNPAAADGNFVNAKIRLFHAGGFGREVPTSGTAVKFDYVRLNTVTPAPYVGYLDDEFNASALGPQWETHPGIGPGTVGFNNGNLMLTGGPWSDLWEHLEQPLFIYQDAPAIPHYTSTIKAGPTQLVIPPDFAYELFNSYGIWLWRDQSNWILISNQRGEKWVDPAWVPETRIEAVVKRDGLFHSALVDFNTGNAPEYLRIENNNGICKLLYSFDNSTWSTVSVGAAGTQFDLGAQNLQLRLFTKRTRDSSVPIDAAFDWLRSAPVVSDVQDWQLY